jgi:large subunit ribosomal protein L13e
MTSMIALKPKVFKKGGKQRCGKGFSREELKKAGINLKEALKLGIPVDFRRKTLHNENVDAVKAFMEKEKAKPKSKGKSKS